MDLAILQSIQQQIGHPVLDAVMIFVTTLGQAGAVWIVVGVAMLCSSKWRFWGITLLVALAAVGLLNEVALKYIVARPRPFVDNPAIDLIVSAPSGYSFPSGHTGTSFAAVVVLAFSPLRKEWKLAALVLAAAIAFSRLYLQVHYPTDVMAGMVLGIIYGLVVVKIALALRRLRQKARGAQVAGPGDAQC